MRSGDLQFDPDDAALIGALHVAPSWILEPHDGILAVDIGGTHIRCGIVEARWRKAADLVFAFVPMKSSVLAFLACSRQ